MDPFLVVGLWNPGAAYRGNRHNVGFLVLGVLAERVGGRFSKHKARADVVEGRLGPPPAPRGVLAEPRSYMNESGGPVAGLCSFYKIPVEQLVVVHDELDLPYGVLRLKRGGGDNGHNGLRSITAAIGAGYTRVRFGIGRPPGRMDPAAFVLRDFTAAERDDLDFHVDRAADAVEALVTEGLERAQNTFTT